MGGGKQGGLIPSLDNTVQVAPCSKVVQWSFGDGGKGEGAGEVMTAPIFPVIKPVTTIM